MLNIATKVDMTTQKIPIKTSELIKHRYSFFMSMMKSYVRYSQMVDNKSKVQVTEAVDSVVDDLVAKYSLGSQFAYDIKSFINTQYMKSHIKVLEEFKAESDVPEGVFDTLLSDFTSNSTYGEIHKVIGPRFMSILR